MEKQKLAQLVMQKMQERKEQEDRNRPHYEVLRLEATFEKEIHDGLQKEISVLEALLKTEKHTLTQLQTHLQDLDNTGKRNYPRIVIMPDFIASQHIQPTIKEFYIKASNSFLRADILRNKAYSESVQQEKNYLSKIQEVSKLEEALTKKNQADRKILNQKRQNLLKEDLRLRAIKEEQSQAKLTIEREKQGNKDLLQEYELKKTNLHNRKDHLEYVDNQIQLYKNQIEKTYNPLSYREHLQNIFNLEMKTESMQKHLTQVAKNVKCIDNQTKQYVRSLEKTASLKVLGRTSDSPSMRKGKIQNRLQSEKERSQQQTGHSSMVGRDRSESRVRTVSQHTIRQPTMDLDFSKGISTARNSQKTTDRSLHPRQRSELAKRLF